MCGKRRAQPAALSISHPAQRRLHATRALVVRNGRGGAEHPRPKRWKDALRARLYAWYTRIERFVVGGSRQRVLAIVAALALLAVALSVVAVITWPRPPAPTVAAVATFTSAPSATPTRPPTHTALPQLPPTPPPHSVPTAVPTTPPPPPIPTPSTTPTVTFCPTATPTPPPTATPTTPPTATATAGAIATASATGSPAAVTVSYTATCTPCPYYTGNNPSQAAIGAALDAAADAYHLPRNLLRAVAWQESRWHEDAYSCDGGIGLMQVQSYTWQWIDQLNMPNCQLAATSYDPTTLAGNAGLGAKYLAYLSCFYSYDGGVGGTLAQPGADTMAWYYQRAGLRYPDTTNPNGSPNPASRCAAVFNSTNDPYYPDLPATTASPWSCPYSATSGDSTLLDITLSAYNEGPGYTDQCGICNPWYVAGVEGYIPQFFQGILPQPS